MPTAYAVVRIDAKLMQLLRAYGDHTGVPANRCVNEAVSEWLKTVAPARLEFLGLSANEIKRFAGISHREIKRKPQRLKA